MITYQSMIDEFKPHQFTAFASDLYDDVPMIRQGFPRTIQTSIGNKQQFIAKTKKLDEDGDIKYVRYSQLYGCVNLIIYND